MDLRQRSLVLRGVWVLLCALVAGGAQAQTGQPAVAALPGPAGTYLPGSYVSGVESALKRRYVSREFRVAGTARSYGATTTPGSDGRWSVTPDLEAGYATRLLVRRPRRVEDFNGTVIVEWLNASASVGTDPGWILGAREYIRRGYAYVAVSAQLVDVRGLKSLDRSRYRALHHPGDAWSYDIYAQAAAAAVSPQPGGPRPLGPLTDRVERVIAHGQSQSTSRLWTYYNAVAPLNTLFDGFYIHSAGFPERISQSVGGGRRADPIPLPPGSPVPPDIDVPLDSLLRTDLNRPTLVLLTEADVVLIRASRNLHRVPDTPHIRVWEIAGAGHVDTRLALGLSICPGTTINPDLHTFVFRAGIRALARWVAGSTPPTIAPRLKLIDEASNRVMRDPDTGIAVGGIRLPAVAVPIATVSGVRPGADLDIEQSDLAIDSYAFFCRLAGSVDIWNDDHDLVDGLRGLDGSPFPEPPIATRYLDMRTYRARVAWSAIGNVLDGFLLIEDAAEALDAAPQPDPCSWRPRGLRALWAYRHHCH